MYSIFNGGVNVLSTFEALDFIQLFFLFVSIFLKIRTITWVLYAFILKFRHVAGGMSNKNDAHCT